MRRTVLTAIGLIAFFSVQPYAHAQTDYDTSPAAQTGVQMFGSYFATDIDTVSTYNRNLHLSIALFSIPGRELPLSLGLSYNGQKWEQDTINYSAVGRYSGGWTKANLFGSAPSFFATQDPNTEAYTCYVYWIDGSGAKHKYVPDPYGDSSWCQSYSGPSSWNSQTLVSMDTDGSTLWTGTYETNGTDAARINFKNGTIRYFRTSNSSITYDYVTPNGNYLINSSNASGLPTQDTLGRTVGYACSGCGGTSWTETYTVTDSNNQQQTYVLSWSQTTSFNGTTFVDPIASNHPTVQMTLLNSVTLPNGKSYTFEYNNQHGMLTKVTFPSGAYIRYTYVADSCDTTSTVTLEHVSQRALSVDGTTGGEQVTQYTTSTPYCYYPVLVTSPVGDVVAHYFNTSGQESATEWRTSTGTVLKRAEMTWAQDYVAANGQAANGRVTETKKYLNGTLYSTEDLAYDSNNMNLLQNKITDTTGAVKNEKDYAYTTLTGNYSVKTQETLTAIDPASGNFVLQGKTQYSYDEFTLTARSGVPNSTGGTSSTNRGNLTTTTRYTNATNSVAEHTKYDSVGNVIETDDALGHATLIDFTDNFMDNTNRSTFAYPTKMTNALGQFVTTRYDFITGLVKQATNLRGFTTTTAYDLMNRQTSVTEPNGKQTTYSYDDTNRVTTKEVTVDSAGNKGHIEASFDQLYRVTETRTNDPAGVIAVDTVYDAKGRKSQESNPYRLSSEVPVSTTTTYDATDRPLMIQAPDGSTINYAYTFNQTTVTDQAGHQRRYTYNPLGQLTEVEEPNPSLVWNTPLVTTYEYYGFGPRYQSNQSGQLRTFVSDWLSEQTSQTLPESGTTTFVYDAAGRATSKTDARSISTTISYDNLNRMTGTTYSDSTPAVTVGYDANGYTGLKTSMTDAAGSVSYIYDSMNRLTDETRTLNGVSGTFSTGYAHNIKGDLTQMTYPSGRIVDINYATGGGCCNSRLSSITDQTTGLTLANGFTFDAAGDTLVRVLNPGSNAVTETFQYNSRQELTQIADTTSSTTLMNFVYDYGAAATNTGRLLSRTDTVQPEHSQSYTYDSVYRLANVISGDKTWLIGWTFDVWGNRTTQTPQGLAASKIGTQTNGYTNNRNNANTYDAAGNQTGDGLHTYTFSAENQILSMDGGAVTYAYDGDGKRIKKITSTETTYTFYGPGGIISEFTTSNAITTATSASSGDKCLYHTTDKLGSAVLVINSNGIVIENNRTLPYGEQWLSDTASTNDKKFTTYQRDAESGLDYAMNRYNSSTMGRFVSVDPGGKGAIPRYPQSWNAYAYSGNDPINRRDPGGTDFYACFGSSADSAVCDYVQDEDWALYLEQLQLVGVLFEGNDEGGYGGIFYCGAELVCGTATYVDSGGGSTGGGSAPSTSAGGGSSPAPSGIHVSSISLGNTKALGVQKDLAALNTLLHSASSSDCLSFLQSGGGNLTDSVNLLLGNVASVNGGMPNIGVADWDSSSTNAITGSAGTDLSPAWFGILISETGGYYNPTQSAGDGSGITGGTNQAKALILIHELAHFMGASGFLAGDNTSDAQTANNATVLSHCQSTIDSFKSPN